MLEEFKCTFLVASLTVLQSVNPNIDIVFLLFVPHFTLIIGNVEVNPSPLTNDISNTSLVKVSDSRNTNSVSDIDQQATSRGTISVATHNIRRKGFKLNICNTYRSDYSDNQYWTRIKHAIEMAFEINPNVVITGDTNSDLFNAQNNKLSEIMTFFNFKNVINKPTRITAHSSTILDPIIISDAMSSIYSDVLNVPSEISDHDAAVAYIECPNCVILCSEKVRVHVTCNHTVWINLKGHLDRML
jgi:hypothetical protein